MQILLFHKDVRLFSLVSNAKIKHHLDHTQNTINLIILQYRLRSHRNMQVHVCIADICLSIYYYFVCTHSTFTVSYLSKQTRFEIANTPFKMMIWTLIHDLTTLEGMNVFINKKYRVNYS